MTTPSERQLIAQAKAALKRGERKQARRLAQRIVAENPDSVEGWLLLGGLSQPKASFAYIQIAAELAPDAPQVLKALAWARHRIGEPRHAGDQDQTRRMEAVSKESRPRVHPPIAIETHSPIWLWTIIFIAVLALIFYGLDLIPSEFVRAAERAGPIYQENFAKPSLTPTPTNTATSTPTPTLTLTPMPTASPTPTSTATVSPTATKIPTKVEIPTLPDDIDDERWIDVDLSSQRLYAYQGKTIVASFLVSTGTWQHPTLTGQYHVYIKLRYTDMSGPGYFLPDVPYTMYYYKGYGIHGTYWHNNFGTPMSHGCVNMRTADAAWLFNWSYVGIQVNVHE